MEEMKWIITSIYLIWLAVCDWRKCRVSVWGLILGAVGALVFIVVERITGQKEGIEIVLGALPGIFLLMLAWLTKKVGYADGIVLLIIGVLYGYAKTVFLLCMSMLLLACVSGVFLTCKKASRNTMMPYIPSLAVIFILQGVLL